MPLIANPLCQMLGIQYPFWQAPLPFACISAEMSGKISAHGGLGILRIAEHDNCDSLSNDIAAYNKHHSHPAFCFSHRLPQHPQGEPADTFAVELLEQRYQLNNITPREGDHFLDLLDLVLAAQPRALGFAQGLPDRETLALISAQNICTFAICSNMLEALTADDFGCDVIVLQGAEAGGERSRFTNTLEPVSMPALSLLQQARKVIQKPLVVWGDYSAAPDMIAAIICGAQSIMLDRPFLACPENDLDDINRQRAACANEYDTTISDQYTVRPMRCLYTDFTRQPEELLIGNEALFAATFARKKQYRPLPVSVSAIAEPQSLVQYFQHMAEEIRQYIA